MAIIIFGRQRSGTTLLTSFLNSHPELKIEGEILHPTRQVRGAGAKVINNISNQYWGFNLKYNHVSNWITSNFSKFKIVHVLRRDLLSMAISSIINTNKPKYKKPSETKEKIKTQKYYFDIEKVKNVMTQNKKLVSRWVKNLSECYENVYPVFYEDFTKGGTDVKTWSSLKLCNFLEIIDVDFETDCVKVNPTNVEEIAINYEELIALPNRSL